MNREVSLSKDAHETIYCSWPDDAREQVEDGLSLLGGIDPKCAMIAPSPPYPPHIGHLHSFKFKREDIFQYVSVFYVFSNDLDRVLVTDIVAIPGFRERVSEAPLAAITDSEFIEIPQRP